MRKSMLAPLLLVLAALPAVAVAQPAADFFKGRQITMLVGAGAGGGYDVYARVWARHASRHIPGQPTIVAKNMPAAAGIAAANALYNNSDRDGLTMAALPNGTSMDPLAGNAAARFEPLRMIWVGSIGKLQNVCATWHTSPVTTIEAARQREVVVAGAGATSNSAIMPRILNELLGTRFKIVAGYDPTSGLTLALERGEAEGICGLSWSTIKASRPHWIKDKLLNVIVQVGVDKLPDLPDVPGALELVADAHTRAVLELVLIRQEIGRPIVLPPDVPADRVAALRQAFAAVLRDAAFLADAEKAGMEIEPLSGAEVEAMLAKAYGAEKPIIARMVSLIEPSAKGK